MWTRRRVRRLIGLAAALLFAGGVVGAAGSPAFAHASLVATSPAHGAELDGAPVEIRLRFSEQVTIAPDGVSLRDSAGAVVGTGPATHAVDDPTTVVLPVPDDLADGRYVVVYRVISADSHPVSGALAFGVGMSAGSLDELDLAGEDPAVAAVFAGARWVSYAGLALLAGGLAVFVLCWPGGWVNRRARRLVTIGWAASLSGGVAVLLLQGPYGAGRSLVSVTDPALLSATIDTDYGSFVLVRLALVVAAAALVFRPLRPPTAGHAAGALAVGLVLPATWIGTGHAATSDRVLDPVAEVAHLVAMSTWFGGLAILLTCVLPRSVVLPADEVATMLRRFSVLATTAVATLVVTGTYVAWRRVGTLEALLGTSYGRLLAFKLAALGLLLWLGAMSRSVVQRRYARAATPDLTDEASRSRRRAARAAQAGEESARTQLRHTVRLEAGAAVVVLAVASVLVATPPGTVVTAAEALQTSRDGPVLDEVTVGVDGTVQVLVDPAWVGRNRIVVELVDPLDNPWDAPEVWGTFHLPGRAEDGPGPLPVEMTRAGPGLFQTVDATVPVPGDWVLTVVVRTTEIDTVTVQVDVPVS
jgi:copper transport protein